MMEFLVLVVVFAISDVFYDRVIGPWVRKRPVKGAFVKPR
jgi:hypothetical protein